jgi:hypothetical protein
MKTYYIRVTESLVKTVEVHAENEQEALQKAEDSYYNDEFELDYNDRVDTEFENDTEGTLESYDNGGMPKFYEIQ